MAAPTSSNNNNACAESIPPADNAAMTVGELDILCGKETAARKHKGSLYFKAFVQSYVERYTEAKGKHKRGAITQEMYERITQANIRFLRFNPDKNGWEEMTSTAARDKITHALKYAQKKQQRKSKTNIPERQDSDSSRRSESTALSATSGTSATSLDWETLLKHQQQHLAALNLTNMSASLRACRLSKRPSISSVGSGSYLSPEDSGRSNRQRTASNKSVSFSTAEPTVCAEDLTDSLTTNSVTSASIPLPVDLSSIQHSWNSSLQTSTDIDQIDRPPRMPSRPTDEDLKTPADFRECDVNNESVMPGNPGIPLDTLMETTTLEDFDKEIIEIITESDAFNADIGEETEAERKFDDANTATLEDFDNKISDIITAFNADKGEEISAEIIFGDSNNDCDDIDRSMEAEVEPQNAATTACPPAAYVDETSSQQQQQQPEPRFEEYAALMQEPLIEWDPRCAEDRNKPK